MDTIAMTFFLVVMSQWKAVTASPRWRLFAVTRQSVRLWCAFEAAQSSDQAHRGSKPTSSQFARPLAVRISRRDDEGPGSKVAASETHDGRLIASCSLDHPLVCRCCNYCPKS